MLSSLRQPLTTSKKIFICKTNTNHKTQNMKSKIMSLLLCSLSFSQAATYVLTNNQGAPASSNAITDSSGVAFKSGTAGVASVGYFNIDDAALTAATSASIFTSNFVAWNTATSPNADGSVNFVNSTTPVFARGYFTMNAASRTVAGSAFENKNMYILVGNGLTFATSTEFLVLKSTSQFLAANDPTLPNVTVRFTDSNTSVLFGTAGASVQTTNTDASSNTSWRTLAPVPETSTSLLGAIGALALLRRRRN